MYSQEVPVSFKMTMATLGPEAYAQEGRKASGRTILMLTHQKDGEFALCSLAPEKHDQQGLDVIFMEGETIHLRVVGENAVHLTGYYIEDAEDDPMAGYDDDEIDAELNGEDIEDETSGSGEEVDEEDDEEIDSDLADFIDDDEEDEEEDDEEDSDVEVVDKKSRKKKSTPCIREVTEDDEEEDECGSECDSAYDSEEEEDSEALDSDEDSYETGDSEEFDSMDSEDDDDESDSSEEEAPEQKKPVAKKIKLEAKPAAEVKSAAEAKPAEKKLAEKPPVAVKSAPGKENVSPTAGTPNKESSGQTSSPVSKTLANGLKIEDLSLGQGIKAQKGRRCTISYTIANEAGKTIASSQGKEACSFILGETSVQKAIGLGIVGMALGGERQLIVPANMVEDKAQPAIPKAAGNCTIKVKLEAVQSLPKTATGPSSH